MEAKRAFNELSTDSRILIDFIVMKLIKEKVEVVTYGELSASINRNVCKGAYGNLHSARHVVQQEQGVMIVTVPKVGIKLSTDFRGQIDRTVKHINKTTRRVNRTVLTALPNAKLPRAETTAVLAGISCLGALQLLSKPSSVRKIEGKVGESLKELPTAETMKLFE